MSTNNIGIGIANPKEKLHVNGGVLLGNSTSNNNGTIRWTGTDFQGRTDGAWVSMTSLGLKGDTGNQGIPGVTGNTGSAGSAGSAGSDGTKGASGSNGSKGEPGGVDGFITFSSTSHNKPNGTLRFENNLLQVKKNDKWYVIPLGRALDTIVPTGYSVNAFTVSGTTATFTMAGAETGTALGYTISSSGGGTSTGYNDVANVTSATESVSGIDVSGFNDGTLTVSVILTDTSGNSGNAATKTVAFDKTDPTGYSVSAFTLDGDNATFTMAGAEIGVALAYTITTSGGAESVSGAVANTASATESVSSIDISSLSDGTLTVSVKLTDDAANEGSAATKTVEKAAAGLYEMSSPFTFTNCSGVGRYGPTLAECKTIYPDWADNTDHFNTSSGIQIWTVPSNGSYKIEAYGATGGDDHKNFDGGDINWGGSGAKITGTFLLVTGDKIRILVGQKGVPTSRDPGQGGCGSGGGGTFVTKNTGALASSSLSDILVIAGGGGGGGWKLTSPEINGRTSQAGGNTYDENDVLVSGGTGGNGGDRKSKGSGGGGGYLTNGSDVASNYGESGFSFRNGGTGGWNQSLFNNGDSGCPGGFGGGGSLHDNHTGGSGGGGFSGGGGGASYGDNSWSGGGGGSYNADQTTAVMEVWTHNRTATGQERDGKVIITKL